MWLEPQWHHPGIRYLISSKIQVIDDLTEGLQARKSYLPGPVSTVAKHCKSRHQDLFIFRDCCHDTTALSDPSAGWRHKLRCSPHPFFFFVLMSSKTVPKDSREWNLTRNAFIFITVGSPSKVKVLPYPRRQKPMTDRSLDSRAFIQPAG